MHPKPEVNMTEDEADEIVGTIVLAKMNGAKFKIFGDPLKNERGKSDIALVLMQDKEVVWRVVLYKGISNKADLANLSASTLADVMPKAKEYMKRAEDGDRDLYLKGRLVS